MLDLFRKRGLTSFVYGFIIVATIAVFVIQFRPNAGQRTTTLRQTCVATVRGWCIDPKDHKSVYGVLMPRDQEGNPSPSRARAMNLTRLAADALIERELLVGEGERLGLRVSQEEVTDSIFDGYIYMSGPSDRPELGAGMIVNGRINPMAYGAFRDPKTKKFDTKVYERTIRAFLHRSPTEFREEQTREILAAKVRDLVRAPVRVSDLEAFEAYVRERSHATIEYVPVKATYAARYAVSATQADVDAWEKDKANADLVDAMIKSIKDEDKPQAGHIRHILVKVEPTASEGDHTAAVNKLAAAMRRVKAGERFEDVARQVSEDFGSAQKGGDVGEKTDGFVGPFKKAADALKAGETTPAAIQTQFGYHVIKKDDPNPEVLKKDLTRSLYLRQKSDEAAKDLATRIALAIKAGKSAEEATAAALAPLIKPAGGAPRAMPPLEVVAMPVDANADGGATKPMVIVGRAVNADDDPEKPRPETSAAFNRGGDPVRDLGADQNQKVVAFAFGAKPGDVMTEPLKGDATWYAIQAKELTVATREQFDKERATYTQTLLADKRAEALAAYVRRLRERAKNEIKTDEAFLSDVKPDGGAPAPPAGEEEE